MAKDNPSCKQWTVNNIVYKTNMNIKVTDSKRFLKLVDPLSILKIIIALFHGFNHCMVDCVITGFKQAQEKVFLCEYYKVPS